MAWHSVDLEPDHLSSIANTRPVIALTELIWNSVDAEAQEVSIVVADNGLGGVASITVSDDGHGMTHEDAIEGFTHLGGSWKKHAARSRNDERALHGKDGKGRFTAFALGGTVEWRSVAAVDGRRELVTVKGESSRLDGFEIADPIETDTDVGTVVHIVPGPVPPRGMTGSAIIDSLTARFGLQLTMYPNLTIVFDGERLDAETLIARVSDYGIAVPGATDEEALLTVVEWNESLNIARGLHLCDGDGIALDEARVGIQAPGYNFTAYLRWTRFSERASDLLLADSDDEMAPVLGSARKELRQHFANRVKEHGRETVEKWKQDDVYPYRGDAATIPEKVARDTFDVVALYAAPAVNVSDDKRSQRLMLRLLKEGLETDPGSLHRVLSEVLELPPDSIQELDQLLEKTSLANLISMTRLVSDRLEFIEALRLLVFDPETRDKLLERSQLHKILEKETWIFGEEYALTASDRDLTTALRAHRKLLGSELYLDGDSVTDTDGKRRVLDLLLARTVPQSEDRLEHLVVELKAPKVRINDDHVRQIKKYARAVAAEERFNMLDVQWKFVIVSNEMTKDVSSDASQADREPGLLIIDRNFKLWVVTWAQVVSRAEHRLKFLKHRLGYEPADSDAVDYLNQRHQLHLPDHLVLDESGNGAVSG